jgi:cell division protein FtsI/penicillin-binding protein 2
MQYSPSKYILTALVAALSFLLPEAVAAQSSDAFLKQQTAKNISNDDLRGEDMSIRRVALEALGTAAGTVVVMNVQTGRIYSIVNQDWAIKEGFKPCSTIKLVTGVAGIRENLIRPNGNLAKGSYRLGLNDALAYSNNAYFQKVGAKLGSKRMIEYAKALGLGQKTGINAQNEFSGKLPYGNENLRIYSHADDFEVTPLQLAVMVSALTNGGKIIVPRIPNTEYRKANFQGYLRRYLNLPATQYERVIPGMVGAVNYGTARRIKDKERKIAGKTGSCIFKKTWIGLFASVAPIRNPKFSVVVITRGKYARGKYSAAVAGKIYRSLSSRFDQKFNTRLARMEKMPKSGRQSARVISFAKAGPKPKRRIQERKVPPSIGKTTVISYRLPKRESTNKSKSKKKRTSVIIDGKTELIRPRVVVNN